MNDLFNCTIDCSVRINKERGTLFYLIFFIFIFSVEIKSENSCVQLLSTTVNSQLTCQNTFRTKNLARIKNDKKNDERKYLKAQIMLKWKEDIRISY